jgi:hypothetical protein
MLGSDGDARDPGMSSDSERPKAPAPPPRATSSSRAALVARYVGALLALYVIGGWISLLISGQQSIEDKDWLGFYRAGWLWRHGELASLYTDPANALQPFLNPPWFVWFCVPLGAWSSPWPPYLLCVALAVLGALGALLLLRRVTAAPAGHVLTAAALLFGSAAWLGCAQTGQLSGLLLLLAAGALAAWHAGAPFTAGLLLAALAIKPNIALPLLALVAAGRQGRVLLGALAGLALLALSTLPLGAALWSDWRAASAQMLGLAFDGTLAPWMHQTQLAFWAWLLPPRSGLLLPAWLLTATLAAATAARVWWSVRRPDARARLFGQAVLALVVVSPYLFFYDGLLLALPGLAWGFGARGFASRRAWLGCGVLLGLVFAWQHVQMFSHYTGCPPLIGPLCLAWLLIDARDLRAAERAG